MNFFLIFLICLGSLTSNKNFTEGHLKTKANDNPRLDAITAKAKSTTSTSFLLIQNREVLVNLSSEQKPIESQSITKSIVALAIGMLIDQGKILSIEQPISDWYPEFKNGPKNKITLRHLLTHTSGLEAENSVNEIYQSEDCIEFALLAQSVNEPGTVFFYNNKALNLLSGIIEKVSCQRADLWIQQHLFTPLNIQSASWSVDPSGHTYTHAGLKIHANDLAKIGQLLLDQGICEDKRLISKKWVEQSLQPQTMLSSCGFLWWNWDYPMKLSAAIGYGGQYLIVIPESNMIVVRQTEDPSDIANAFNELPELLFSYLKEE